jgi:DNA-binding IclR family transcriptional regulator
MKTASDTRKAKAQGMGTTDRLKPALGVQVIARAAEILRALEGDELGLSLGQIARKVNLPKSTVQRIVAALANENFVLAASPSARVRLGPALLQLGRSVRFQLAEVVRPYMRELSEATQEAVDLAVLHGTKAVFIEYVETPHRLRAASNVGLSVPLHSMATGKAMLAVMDEAQLAKMRQSLTSSTLKTRSVLNWKTLEAELKRIRQTGIAYDHNETEAGISAVSAPLIGPEGEIAAIAVPIPSVRFREREPSLVAALRRCQSAALRALGSTERMRETGVRFEAGQANVS